MCNVCTYYNKIFSARVIIFSDKGCAAIQEKIQYSLKGKQSNVNKRDQRILKLYTRNMPFLGSAWNNSKANLPTEQKHSICATEKLRNTLYLKNSGGSMDTANINLLIMLQQCK